jgi:hypothetical protein
VNRPLSGEVRRRTAIIHRTVRWCTGLSGEPTVGWANGRLGQRSAAQSARDAWPSQRSDGGTGLSGVHRTVSGAPMAPGLQRSTAPFLEGNRAPDSVRWCTGLSGAPPNRRQDLPSGLLPTAPRPLVPIKGTSRHLNQVMKCSQQV